jgi:hypothetical protein
VPDRKHIYADMAKLFLQDLANVEAGIYPVPADHDGSLLALIRRSRIFFEDHRDAIDEFDAADLDQAMAVQRIEACRLGIKYDFPHRSSLFISPNHRGRQSDSGSFAGNNAAVSHGWFR